MSSYLSIYLSIPVNLLTFICSSITEKTCLIATKWQLGSSFSQPVCIIQKGKNKIIITIIFIMKPDGRSVEFKSPKLILHRKGHIHLISWEGLVGLNSATRLHGANRHWQIKRCHIDNWIVKMRHYWQSSCLSLHRALLPVPVIDIKCSSFLILRTLHHCHQWSITAY